MLWKNFFVFGFEIKDYYFCYSNVDPYTGMCFICFFYFFNLKMKKCQKIFFLVFIFLSFLFFLFIELVFQLIFSFAVYSGFLIFLFGVFISTEIDRYFFKPEENERNRIEDIN